MLLYIRVYVRLKLYVWCGSVAAAAVLSEFDRAVAYNLSRLQKSELKLKPEQKASIKHVYEGKDVFVRLPTRFRKSICYEALSSALPQVSFRC